MNKVIIIEGVDGTGKTAVITELGLSLNSRIVQIFSRKTFLECFINDHPTSALYYAMIIFKTLFFILPAKLLGYYVLCDRYVQTVDTYSPDNNFWHNKVLRKLLSPFFIKPEIYIELVANALVIRKRLLGLAQEHEEKDSEYHRSLISDKTMLESRQGEYQKIFNSYDSVKLKLDTSFMTPKEVAREIINFIGSIKK